MTVTDEDARTGALTSTSRSYKGSAYTHRLIVRLFGVVLWRKGGPLQNEVDTPGVVNAADYTAWRARFGNPGSGSGAGASTNAAVPEPSTLEMLVLAATGVCSRRRWTA